MWIRESAGYILTRLGSGDFVASLVCVDYQTIESTMARLEGPELHVSETIDFARPHSLDAYDTS